MKKWVSLGLAAVLAVGIIGCSSGSSGTPGDVSSSAPPDTASASESAGASSEAAGGGVELALVTDLGTIDDKSFNQGAWEGLKKYADEKGIAHKYYQPTEQSDDAYLTAIDLAVKGGAKIVVTPGYLFEVPVFLAQERYPDVNFILVDGSPHNDDYSVYETKANAVGLAYAEEEAGFLAGYAAVKEGATKLGFMGGMAVPAVIRFGYGFVQGADYAGEEMGLDAGGVTIDYHYTGAFTATPEAQTMAASWYNNGTEIIFACGGAVGNSVMKAAEQTSKKVIGVDVDQSFESETVITSAMKGLSASVYDCVKNNYESAFPGGQNLIYSAANSGVGLPMETSRFEKFTQADYDAIFAKLVDKSIILVRDTDSSGSVVELGRLMTQTAQVTEVK